MTTATLQRGDLPPLDEVREARRRGETWTEIGARYGRGSGGRLVSADLTFAALREANASRVVRWHHADTEPWTGADWSNAMCGEAGETANVVKKLRRHETGTSPQGDPEEAALRKALADEIADTVCYLDLLALHYGIDVAEAVVSKFNRVSERQDFPERLGAAEPSSEPTPAPTEPARVVDLMAALEESLAKAKAARDAEGPAVKPSLHRTP